MSDELNPDHPVTSGLRDQWHTVLAILMSNSALAKNPTAELLITPRDVERFTERWPQGSAIVCNEKEDGLHLHLVTPEVAERIAAADTARIRKVGE